MRKAEVDPVSLSQVHRADTRSLEERLAPKLNQAEYLLVLVLAFMLWTAGFVDLFTHTSRDKGIFGLYSLPYFLFLVTYSLGFVFWGLLIFPANSITWFKKGIRFFQQNSLAGMGWFLGVSILLASMFLLDRWVSFPLLEAALALLALLMSAVILFARPYPEAKTLSWRKVLIAFLGALLVIEALFQALSFVRVLPVQNFTGLFTHYGRIYQNAEGYANTTMNKLGWYYPEFRLEEGSRRIVVTGDSFVQGLQVKKEQNLGVVLEKLMNTGAGEGKTKPSAANTEVLGLGLPGYGPSLYLDVALYEYTLRPLQPDEVVVFFHLANDFQTGDEPNGRTPFYRVSEDGKLSLHKNDFFLRHDLQHLIIRGYEPVNPVRTAASHLFLFNLIDPLIQRITGKFSPVWISQLNMKRITAENLLGASSFVFSSKSSESSERAYKVATGLLGAFKQHLDEQGVTMRLVTIPFFPPDFYQHNQGAVWDSKLGEYDLLLPESRLQEFARQSGISFIGLGQYMKESGMTPAEIRNLFLDNGSGHFSSAGHEFAARAIYTCFYGPAGACPVEDQ